MSAHIDRRSDSGRRRGVADRAFSLLELIVVLTILIATAVLVLPMVTSAVATPAGRPKSPSEITTQSTMQVIRMAMVGEQGVIENLGHNPDALPREVAELVSQEPPDYVVTTAPELSEFNPVFGIGWKGPYLLPTGKNDNGEPTVVDGWGHEIKMQIDFDSNGQVDSEESRYMRIVSAGPNGEFETPSDKANMMPGVDESDQLTLSECGDDLVMFLCVPDNRR